MPSIVEDFIFNIPASEIAAIGLVRDSHTDSSLANSIPLMLSRCSSLLINCRPLTEVEENKIVESIDPAALIKLLLYIPAFGSSSYLTVHASKVTCDLERITCPSEEPSDTLLLKFTFLKVKSEWS